MDATKSTRVFAGYFLDGSIAYFMEWAHEIRKILLQQTGIQIQGCQASNSSGNLKHMKFKMTTKTSPVDVANGIEAEDDGDCRALPVQDL